MASFVKFQRGSQAAYDKLKASGKLEDDALYFIYDKQAPENGGLLYLGKILIGGSNTEKNINLKDLLDVDATTNNDGFILQYNNLSKKWMPTSLKQAVESAKPKFISILSGQKNNQSVEQALNKINIQPNIGDIIFLDGVPYIYNGSSWEKLIGSNIENRVESIEEQLLNINSIIDNKIIEAISKTEHLTYKKVNTLPAFPILEEVKNIIFLVPKNDPSEGDIYDEYIYLENNFEKIGVLGAADLDNYVTQDILESSIQNINDDMGVLSNNILNLQNIVNSNLITKSEFNTLKSEVINLSNITTDLQDIVNTQLVTKPEFNTLKSEVTNLSNITTGLQNIVDTQLVSNEKFNILDNKVTTLETTINNLQNNINDNFITKDEFQTQEDKINNLQTTINNLQSNVTTNSESLTSLTQTVISLQDNVSSNLITKTEFNDKVGNLEQLIIHSGKEKTTVVNEIIELQEQMKWSLIENNS